jgi:hypothetical protein
MRFRLRTIFILVAVVACVLGAIVWANGLVLSIEREHFKRSYAEGGYSLDRLREMFGDEVDSWPAPKNKSVD